MASFNKVILVGNLTRDPQVKYLPSGTAVAEIVLAVNRRWLDKQSNTWKEDATFVDVTLWARTAEIAGEYLSKGKQVLIEGRLQTDSWEDRETKQKRSRLRVVGENMTMLGSRGDGGPSGGSGRAPAAAQRGNENSGNEAASFSQDASDYPIYEDTSGEAPPPTDEVPF